MFKIQLLNKISPSGLAKFQESSLGYECAEEIDTPDAVIVRSASMHDMKIPESVRAIARAGAGYNNIPVEDCSAAANGSSRLHHGIRPCILADAICSIGGFE